MTDRRAAIEARLRSMENELAELGKYGEDVYPDGTVLKFKYQFGAEAIRAMSRFPQVKAVATSPKFSYVAFKVKGGWYLTGGRSGGRRQTWDDLVAMWTDGTVTKLKIATDWDKVMD